VKIPQFPLKRRAAAAVAAGLLLAASIGLSLAYWPGLMTWDSIRQYDQALNGGFDDWHPPLMEWIWRYLIPLKAGPAPMLLLQLALSGAGYALLVRWALKRDRCVLAVALAASALMPLAVAMMGIVIKDSLMAAMLLVSVGLLAGCGRGRDWPLRVLAAVLVVLASALRFNAFLAGVPLLAALAPEGWRRTPPRMAALALAATGLLLAAMPIANRLIGAERSGVQLSLVIFDLGGITEHSGVDVFPPLAVADPVKVNHRCYSPVKWDTYAPWAEETCPIGFAPVQAVFDESGKSPMLFLARAALAHPVAYAEHRLAHWNINSRFLVHGDIERAVPDRSVDNTWGYQVRPNAALAAVDAAALLSADTPLGWPAVWMALALGVLLIAYRLPSRGLIAPIALSGLLYGLGYGVFSVASELRYYLWTIVAVAVAALVAAGDLWAMRRDLRRWDYGLVAAPPAVIAALCLLWRVLPGA